MDTIQYYNRNAIRFSDSTKEIDFTETQNKFLQYLKPNSKILDFGCGSGRDTKYFIQKGFQVDAIDGSIELCKIASEFTGEEVKQMLFQELSSINQYDGVWACSSILHLPYKELKDVVHKTAIALKEEGVFYTSFKYSEKEGMKNGRHFTDMTEIKFQIFLDEIGGFDIIELWISQDVRADREDERWLNVIVKKITRK